MSEHYNTMHHKFDKQLWLTPISIIIGSLIIAGSISYEKISLGGTKAPVAQAGTNVTPISVRPVQPTDHVRGNRNAKVVLVEFSDLECPFCKTYHNVMKRIMEKYGNDIAWVYRHNPLAIHPKAQKEAEATECVAELGGNEKFWQYIDKIFEITPANNRLDDAELPKIATSVGIDQKKFEECLLSGRHKARILEDQKESAGQGTPFSVVMSKNGNKNLKGAVSFEVVEATIKELLGK